MATWVKKIKKRVQVSEMKKISVLVIAAFVLFAIFSGCLGPSGGASVSPSGEVKTEVETEEGKVTMTAKEGVGPEWCKAGTTITWGGAGGAATYVIKGITTYKGRQVCEGEYRFTGPQGEGTYSYYFSEDGTYWGYGDARRVWKYNISNRSNRII